MVKNRIQKQVDSLISEVITSLFQNFPSCQQIVLLMNVGRTRRRVAKAEGRAEESGGRVNQSDSEGSASKKTNEEVRKQL